MTTDYLLSIFQWRDHAGDLDGPQSRASVETLLWGCERWLALHPESLDTDEGRRLSMIKREFEDWLDRNGRLSPYETISQVKVL